MCARTAIRPARTGPGASGGDAVADTGRVGSTTDRQLVRCCLEGNSGAWEELIRRYRRLIYSIPVAYRLGGDEAAEVFQRVAVLLFEHLGSLRRVESLPAWIKVTARRECVAFLRKEQRSRPEEEAPAEARVSTPPDIAEALHRTECEGVLAIALESLAEPCHGLLTALYLEEPTPPYSEIGRRLGRPVGSLGPTRTRCLAKLRKIYRRMGGEEP